jgi:hypothetical protein
VPVASINAPAAASSHADDSPVVSPSGDTDPALADRWASAGSSAIDQAGSGSAEAPLALAGRVKPIDEEGELPALEMAPVALPGSTRTPTPSAEVAGPLDVTMGPAVRAMVGSALVPATAAGDAYSRESAEARDAAETGVAGLQTTTATNQQAVVGQADSQIAGLHRELQAERSGIVAEHKAAIATESGQARTEVTQTAAEANQRAQAKADEAEQAQPEGEQKSSGWWDRIKSAGRAVVGAVAGIASAVLTVIRDIVASARQKITGIIKQLGEAIRRRIDAAVQAITAVVRRVATAIEDAIRKAQELVSKLARAAAALARKLWEAAKARLAAAWARLTSAISAAFAAAKAIVAKIAAGAAKLAQILKLLASGALSRLFDAIHDPDKLAAPIIARAAPLAAQVPGKADEIAAQKAGEVSPGAAADAPVAGIPDVQRLPADPEPITFRSILGQAKPITGDEASQLLLEGHIREKESPVPPAPPGETFWSGVGRHLAAAGRHFLQNWMTTLRNIVYALLTFYPVLLQEGPQLWEECKAVVGAGDIKNDPLDTFDHVLGVLRHLMNIVAGLVATTCLWALIIGAFSGPGEAAVYGACESVGLGVLIADAALTLIELSKAAYSATRPGISTRSREAYLSRFAGGSISVAIMLVLVAIAFFAKSLAEKFKPKAAAGLTDAAEEGAGKGGSGKAGPVEEGGGAKPKGAALTPEEAKAGVRFAKDLPGGGRLKLLKDGSLVVCHSPCETIATRFRKELGLSDPDAVTLKDRLKVIADQEKAAVDAGDVAREEAAFSAADALNQDLEAFRLRRLHAITGVDEPTLRTLIRAAADDGELVERLLRRVGNDAAKVRTLLDAAHGDVNALARLSKAVDDFPASATPSGGAVNDPRFAPFANNADMEHFLQRHSIDHFDFAQVRASNSFFPKGTLPSRIQEGIVEALDFIRRSGDAFPDNSPRIHRLRDGTVVQIVRDSGTIVQFFPLDGPGVVSFTREELTAIGRFLGRIP